MQTLNQITAAQGHVCNWKPSRAITSVVQCAVDVPAWNELRSVTNRAQEL